MSFDQSLINEHQRQCTEMKKGLPDGPWMNEPDRIQWVSNGLDCLMIRQPSMGNWCGYVGVPKGHKLFGADYNEAHDLAPISVHGGLTYADKCGHFICHDPNSGKHDDVWWFGFDCAHAYDLSPSMLKYRMENPELKRLYERSLARDPENADVYRDEAYVKNEVENLARQLRIVGTSWLQKILNRIGLRIDYA